MTIVFMLILTTCQGRAYIGGVDRNWTQDEIDADMDSPMICPFTGQPCLTEHDEFCDDYGCARKAGFDVDGNED